MEFLNYLLSLFAAHGAWISFIGGFFGGEEFIIALAFLAAKNFIPIWEIFIFSFLGIFLHDIVVYSIGRLQIVQNIQKFEKFTHVSKRYEHIIVKIDERGTFNLLLITKFVFGTRLLSLFYLGFKKTKIKDFLIASFFVELLWVVIIISLGWIFGNSFYLIWDVFKNIPLAIAAILLLGFALVKLRKWISKKVLGEEKIKNKK